MYPSSTGRKLARLAERVDGVVPESRFAPRRSSACIINLGNNCLSIDVVYYGGTAYLRIRESDDPLGGQVLTNPDDLRALLAGSDEFEEMLRFVEQQRAEVEDNKDEGKEFADVTVNEEC